MALSINSYIVQKLNDMRENGVMCDLELVAEDGTFVLVHSAVWVAAFEDPSCLREMGKEYFLSSNQLDIFGVRGSVLKNVVDFIYGKKVKPTDELKGALEKFGMKNWLKYFGQPVPEKYPNKTKHEEDKYTSISIKIEKDIDDLEEQETADKRCNSGAIIEPKQGFSEYEENKETRFDLSRVKNEPLSPGAMECSTGSLNFSFSSEQQEMEACVEKTIKSSNDGPTSENQIPCAVSKFDNSANSSEELNKESPETSSQAGPFVLNVVSLAETQENFENITRWTARKDASSSRKNLKAPISSRRLQTLLPKQTEVCDSQSREKPSSAQTTDEKLYADKTKTTKNNLSEENMVFDKEANLNIRSKPSEQLKRTNGRPLGPEPVKLFLNNSNLKSLQVGTPWNIVRNSNTANPSKTKYCSSTTVFFPPGTSNIATTTATTSACTSIGTPVPVTSMNPGQKSVSNNSRVVHSSYNSITVPLGAFPNMQGLGANQTPNVMGNAGSGFVNPIAVGTPVGANQTPNVMGNAGSGFVKPIAIRSPLVAPLQLTNSLTTNPIGIGNFRCQVLQNAAPVSVSQTMPVGVNTNSTTPINNTTFQNPGGIQIVNNQLGHLVFLNSNNTNNQKFQGTSVPRFTFAELPQSSSVSSTNVLQNSTPIGIAPASGYSNAQNVIGSSHSNAGVISGTRVMLKGAASVGVSAPSTYTATSSMHTMANSSMTAALSTLSNKFPLSDRKLSDTCSNCEEKSFSIGKTPEKHDTSSSVTEVEVAQKDQALKSIKDAQEKELETSESEVYPTDSDRPFVIDLENEDDDDVNPLEILIAKNTIRNINMRKFPHVLKKTALEFQDINPITKSAMYAAVGETKRGFGIKRNHVAGRKKIAMGRRVEPCLKINEQMKKSPGEGRVEPCLKINEQVKNSPGEGRIDPCLKINEQVKHSPGEERIDPCSKVTEQVKNSPGEGRIDPCVKVNELVRNSPGQGAYDTSPYPFPRPLKKRGRPPKNRSNVLNSSAPESYSTSSSVGTPKTGKRKTFKRKLERTNDLSSASLTKFRPIAPKSNVVATLEVTPLQ